MLTKNKIETKLKTQSAKNEETPTRTKKQRNADIRNKEKQRLDKKKAHPRLKQDTDSQKKTDTGKAQPQPHQKPH